MFLPYEDYRSFYDELGYGESEGRAHFETLTRILDCIVHAVLEGASLAEKLGIDVEIPTAQTANVIEFKTNISDTFGQYAEREKS